MGRLVPLRRLHPVTRQVQLQDRAVMHQPVDRFRGRHRVVDGFMMPPFEIALFVLLAERIRIVP